MSVGKKAYWVLVAATVTVYGFMIFWAGPNIADMSGGGTPFDLHMFGYSHAEAQEFLAALTPGGAAFYLGPAMWLDTFFPAMFAVVLGAGCWILLDHRPLVMRIGAALLAGCYALFDYLENAAVVRMLNSVPEDLSVALVDTASRWTELKFFFVDAAITVLVVLVIARLLERRKNRNSQ